MTIKADLATALPEITLLCAACFILVVDLFLPLSRRHISYWLTQAALALTAWIVLTNVRAA